MRALTLILFSLLFFILGCGTISPTPSNRTDNQIDSPNSHFRPFGLLSPNDALSLDTYRAGSALLLECNGSAYETGMAHRVSKINTSAQFNPDWVSGHSGSEDLAFAIYSFILQGFDGNPTLHFDWSIEPTSYSNLWIGFSHWDDNRWDWYLGPSDGILNLSVTGFSHYTHSGTGEMYVVIVLLGSDLSVLDRLQIGTEDPNSPPTAVLSADPTSGEVPLDVTFDASDSFDSDGSIVKYEWDWDGTGTGPWTVGLAEESHRYSTAGTYRAWVRVTDDDGATGKDDVYINVSTPGNSSPTAVLSADPTSGEVPLDVTFDASDSFDSDGSIVKYEWDWDGTGTGPWTVGLAEESHRYSTAGTYRAWVRVTDDDGATDKDDKWITVNETQQEWITPIILDSLNDKGSNCSLAVIAGCPAISYYANGELGYIKSTTVDGDSGSEWSTPIHPPDTGYSASNATALIEMSNGCPGISYDRTNSESGFYFVTSTDSAGTSWNSPSLIDERVPRIGSVSLILLESNKPATTHMSVFSTPIYYTYSDDVNGSSWSESVQIATGNGVSLSLINSFPAISHKGSSGQDLYYTRAQNSGGIPPWHAESDIYDATYTYETFLLVLETTPTALPAIIFRDVDDLMFVSSTDASGDGWNTPILISTDVSIVSGAIINGYPAAVYFEEYSADLYYVEATNKNGSEWTAPVLLYDGEGSLGALGTPSLAELANNNAAVAFYETYQKDLMYSVRK